MIAICLSHRKSLSLTSGEAEQGLKRRNSDHLVERHYELWLTLLRMSAGKQSVEATFCFDSAGSRIENSIRDNIQRAIRGDGLWLFLLR